MSRALLATYHNPMRVCDSADFDGTNDHMARGAGLTGAADSKTGIFSAWVRLDGGDTTLQYILYGEAAGNPQFFVIRNGSNKIVLQGENPGDTDSPLTIISTSDYLAGATWRHILASWDVATDTAHLFVNDVNDESAITQVNDTIDYTLSDWSVGARVDAGAKLNGCVAELYFAPGQYLDLSLVANRRKFISASGKPVHLGTTGSLPTGTAPLAYFHLDDGEAVANFGTNRGTGGNFTITGTLDTGSSSPSD